MKKTRNLKTGFYVLLTFLCIMIFGGVKPNEVMAAEGDIQVMVYVDGAYEKIEDLTGVSGISYDSANNVLTLNNYNGGPISVSSVDENLKSMEVKVVGNNRLHTVDSFDSYDLLYFENIDVTFTGSGKLDLDLKTPGGSSKYAEQYYKGSITIDGPTINLNDSMGSFYMQGDFTMKSGTLNIERMPQVYMNGDHARFNYYAAICSEGVFSALGGNINIEYVYPSGYENVGLTHDTFYAIVSDHLPIIKDCKIRLTTPDELQGNLYLMEDTDIVITVYDVNGGTLSVDKAEGISWDKDKLCLTFDGYNNGSIRIQCNYIADIEIKVIGDNTITSCGYLDHLLCYGNSIRMTGDGTINFVNDKDDVYSAIWGNDDFRDSTFTLDGPTLNYTSDSEGYYQGFICFQNIEILSGTINAKIIPTYALGGGTKYRPLLYANEGDIDVKGGTIIADYVPTDDNEVGFKSLMSVYSNDYYGNPATINTSNCVIVVAGRGTKVDNEVVFENRNSWDDEPRTNVGDNTVIIFADELKYALPIDINLLKGELSESTFVYDGKKKEPKVKVGGLVEGVDFTVTYSNNVDVGTATATVTGKGNYKGTMKLSFKIISDPKKSGLVDGPAKGTTVKDKKYIYKVTKPGSTDGGVIGELEVCGLKKKSLKQIKIAAKVKINSVTYKVTSVGAKAFKGNKKVTKATIGKNVVKIGANAFAKCSKLKQLTINSKVLRSIGKNACAGDKKLVKVIIKSKKLKKVGKKAFYRKGGKKLIVKVPKAKKAKYENLLKKAKTNKFKVK